MCVMEIRALQVLDWFYRYYENHHNKPNGLFFAQFTNNAKQASWYVVPCKLICMRILRGIELELGGKVSARQDSIAAVQNV